MRAAPLVEGWGVLVGVSDRAVVPPGAAAGFVVASGFVSLTWPASQSHGAKQQRDGKKIQGASSHIRLLLKIRPLSPPPRPRNGSVHTDRLSFRLFFLKPIQSCLLIGQADTACWNPWYSNIYGLFTCCIATILCRWKDVIQQNNFLLKMGVLLYLICSNCLFKAIKHWKSCNVNVVTTEAVASTLLHNILWLLILYWLNNLFWQYNMTINARYNCLCVWHYSYSKCTSKSSRITQMCRSLFNSVAL